MLADYNRVTGHLNYLLKWKGYFGVAVLIALRKSHVAGGGVILELKGESFLRSGIEHRKGGLVHEGVLVPALSLPDDPAHSNCPVGVTVDSDAESVEREKRVILILRLTDW